MFNVAAPGQRRAGPASPPRPKGDDQHGPPLPRTLSLLFLTTNAKKRSHQFTRKEAITTTVTAALNVKPSNHHLITTVKKGSHHLHCRHPRNCQRYVPLARHRPGDTIIALPEPRPSDSAVSKRWRRSCPVVEKADSQSRVYLLHRLPDSSLPQGMYTPSPPHYPHPVLPSCRRLLPLLFLIAGTLLIFTSHRRASGCIVA